MSMPKISIKSLATLILIGMSLLITTAYAGISVSPLIINFVNNGSVYQDIKVTNQSDQKEYVAVMPYEITSPGQKDYKEKLITNPQEAGLLTTPVKIVLLPKQSSIVRLSLIKPAGEKERIYRVQIEPRTGFIQKSETQNSKGIGVNLNILLAYSVKVRVAPLHPKMDFTASRDKTTFTFTNTGNITTIITNGKQQCPEGKICTAILTRAIYPGETTTFNLPQDKPVSYELYTAVNPVKKYESN